jgi:hypothetical protein
VNEQNKNIKTDSDEINKMIMDDKGNIRTSTNGSVALTENTRLFTILGWVSTSLAAFVSPIFALGGITFGVLLNKKNKGRGNMIIIANAVLGLFNFILGYFFLSMIR